MPDRARHAEPSSASAQYTLIDAYTTELAARQTELRNDLAVYQRKLSDLGRLDPLDFTGLQHLYGTHISQIEALLSEFNDA